MSRGCHFHCVDSNYKLQYEEAVAFPSRSVGRNDKIENRFTRIEIEIEEDFLARRPFLFTEMTISQIQKVEKLIRRCKIGRLAKGRIFGRNPNFCAQKAFTSRRTPCSGHTSQSCAKKKVPFSQININLLANSGCFFWKKMDF